MSLIFPDGSYTRNFRPQDFGGGPFPQYAPQFGMPTQTVSGDPRGGWATAAPQDRPPPFQMGPVQGPWGQAEDPFAARMDFVNQMQQQNMQRQMMFNNGGFAPPQTWNQNPFQMYRPGMAQPIQPPSQGNPYGGGQADPNYTGLPPSMGPGVQMQPQPPAASNPFRVGIGMGPAAGQQPSAGPPGNGFVDARQPGMAYASVLVDYYNPATGETTQRTRGVEPAPGSGWIKGRPPAPGANAQPATPPNYTGLPPSVSPGSRMDPNPRPATPRQQPFSRNQFAQSGAQPRRWPSNAPARKMTQQEMRQFSPMPTTSGPQRQQRMAFPGQRFKGGILQPQQRRTHQPPPATPRGW